MQLTFLLKSLWHYRRSHLGVLAGTIVGATVLLGAIFAGDSVKFALKRLASLRVGQTDYIVTAGDRFFSQNLADRLDASTGLDTAPALLLRGSASRSERKLAASQVQILGVDKRFWKFAPREVEIDLDSKRSVVALNRRLATQLELEVGDSFVFRLEKPGLLSRDAPLSGSKSNVVGMRVTVMAIVEDDQFGRFGLQASQISPSSIFAPIDWIQEQIGYPGRVNLLLAKEDPEAEPRIGSDTLETALGRAMNLSDYGIELRDVALGKATEIRSERVFIDEPMVEAIQEAAPENRPVITYFANSLRHEEREAPYSLVTATTSEAAPFLPEEFGSEDTVINEWLANDLEIGVGDTLEMDYFVVDEANRLLEESARFTVRAVVSLDGLAADGNWMPDFPGVAEAEDSSDWEPGMPLDLDRIRDKDEDYWDDYRGVPKAFISLQKGRTLWTNRWGDYTALRVPVSSQSSDDLEDALLRVFNPNLLGLQAISIREKALGAAQSPVDIGGLFLSMSFFLIIASLSLTGMLYSFSLQKLNRENALFSALGFPDRTVFRWRMISSLCLVTIGSCAALPIAAAYTWGILRFLETIWSSETTGTLFALHGSPIAIGIGVATNVVLAMLVIRRVLRKQGLKQASLRLQQGSEDAVAAAKGSSRRSVWTSWIGLGTGGLLLAFSVMELLPPQLGFFLTGFMLLIGGLGLFSRRVAKARSLGREMFTPTRLGCLNRSRRPLRSLAVAGTLACGVFLVVSVAAFRKNGGESVNDPQNGYGGYTYWIETSMPMNDRKDIQGPDNVFGLTDTDSVLSIRVGQGDDASCFNLNQTATPRLLALKSSDLARRDAFSIGSALGGWMALEKALPDGAIPALVDSATLQWALKRKVGDRLAYQDAWGETFYVEIVGTVKDSLFQGSVLIDERLFLERFPQHEGYRAFLADDWEAISPKRQAEMEFALSPWGGQVVLASERLQAFHEVENTYIAIFHVLGGLGVILGSAGLGVVVGQNLLERRHEFGLMGAIGISSEMRRKIVFSELGGLIVWGVGIGLCAAVVSIIPLMNQVGAGSAVLNIGILTLGIVANAIFWSYVSYRKNQPAVSDLQREFDS